MGNTGEKNNNVSVPSTGYNTPSININSSNLYNSSIGLAASGAFENLFGDTQGGHMASGIFGSVFGDALSGLATNGNLNGAFGSSKSDIAGIGAGLIGNGIESWGNHSKLAKFTGGAVSNGLGTIGSQFLNGKTISINPLQFGMNVVGSGLSAMNGPSKEYQGRYGGITRGMDTAYDYIRGTVGAAVPWMGAAMTLNKGLSNLFGSTDGMTKQDAILGSAFMPAPVKWLNMAGAKKTGTFDDYSWQNREKTAGIMGSYGNLESKIDKAMEEAGKTYGTFSRGARKRALRNLDYANSAWEKLLNISGQSELGMLRSATMDSINTQRYAQDIQGGINLYYRGKHGMKIPKAQYGRIMDIRRAIQNKEAQRENIELLLKDNEIKEEEGKSYYNPETNTIHIEEGKKGKEKREFLKHEKFHQKPNELLLEFLRPYYEDLDDNKIQELGGDLEFVKRINGDPNHFYNPEEIGARVVAARYRAGNKYFTPEFFRNLRGEKNENKYGDNMRDLLHMYNDDILSEIFKKADDIYGYWGSPGIGLDGKFIDPTGEIGDGQPLTPTGRRDEFGHMIYIRGDGALFTVDSYKKGGPIKKKIKLVGKDFEEGEYIEVDSLDSDLKAGRKPIGKDKRGRDIFLNGDGNGVLNQNGKQTAFKEGGTINSGDYDFMTGALSFRKGGSVNVIPEGALHARKHHMENSEDLTLKGIPVIDNEGRQQAEIECNEIIFRKEVTDKVEKLKKDFEEATGSKKDEIAIQCGKLLTKEILGNTDDRTGLLKMMIENAQQEI